MRDELTLPLRAHKRENMYHIIINSNRIKGRAVRKLEAVKNVFDRAGKKYCLYFTQYAGHARDIAAELTRGNEKVSIIAMGGDGTLHEVLNGIRDISLCELGIIPAGSGNDFAAAIGIPADAKYAAQIIAFKAPSKIDYIELSSGLRSINAVGCGMDADIIKNVMKSDKLGKSKYIFGFLKSVFTYKARPFTIIREDGTATDYNGLLACLGNGCQIGAGIKLFPEAQVDDGFMDFLIVDYISPFRALIAFIKLFFGKLDTVKGVTKIRCRKATIIPRCEKITVQAEGELYETEGGYPLTAELVRGKLLFYLPHND